MGRPPTYRNGPVRVWSGDIASDQNSQQISDPYTFTHVIHGAVFYGDSGVVPPASVGCARWSRWPGSSVGSVREHRHGGRALSRRDHFARLLRRQRSQFDLRHRGLRIGFLLTWRPPRLRRPWMVIAEIILAFWIRDNLTLNIIMLVHPFDAIRSWQAGT